MITPLEPAGSHGHERAVELLLEQGANHLRGRRRGMALFEAIRRGIRCTAQAFHDHRAHVNVLTYKRKIRNPLIAASMYGHADVVQVLLERTDIIQCSKCVAQMIFCCNSRLGYVTIVRMLVEQCIDPDWLCGEESPMYEALRHGQGGLTKKLDLSNFQVC